MHGAATSSAQEQQPQQQPANATNTAVAITADVGNIVGTAANLVQNHDKQTILASVGQLLNSIFSIVSTLVAHKRTMEPADCQPVMIELQADIVDRFVAAIDSTREYLKTASLSELGCALQQAEREAIAVCRSDDAQDDAAAAQDDASAEADDAAQADADAQAEQDDAAAEDNDAALADDDASAEADDAAQAADDANVQAAEQEEQVLTVLHALIHDTFAIIQSSETDEAIGGSIADMLTNIVELALDTIKYEQVGDVETCAAAYIDRVCAELNRQIRHLMVQSALTLRGSECSVACCKNPGRACAAALNMIMGNRGNGCCNNNGCCKPCARPSCNNCSTCNTCSQKTSSCCCDRSPMSDMCAEKEMCDTMRGCNNCGCSQNCNTCKPGCSCKSADMSDDAEMCKCQCGCSMPSRAIRMDIKRDMMNKCSCCAMDCQTCRSMNCAGSTRACPCQQKPQQQTTTQGLSGANGRQAKAASMMAPMQPAKSIMVRCACATQRPQFGVNRPQSTNRPQVQQSRPVTASRKEGNRVVPEQLRRRSTR
jgi:hypothetical protein